MMGDMLPDDEEAPKAGEAGSATGPISPEEKAKAEAEWKSKGPDTSPEVDVPIDMALGRKDPPETLQTPTGRPISSVGDPTGS